MAVCWPLDTAWAVSCGAVGVQQGRCSGDPGGQDRVVVGGVGGEGVDQLGGEHVGPWHRTGGGGQAVGRQIGQLGAGLAAVPDADQAELMALRAAQQAGFAVGDIEFGQRTGADGGLRGIGAFVFQRGQGLFGNVLQVHVRVFL